MQDKRSDQRYGQLEREPDMASPVTAGRYTYSRGFPLRRLVVVSGCTAGSAGALRGTPHTTDALLSQMDTPLSQLERMTSVWRSLRRHVSAMKLPHRISLCRRQA